MNAEQKKIFNEAWYGPDVKVGIAPAHETVARILAASTPGEVRLPEQGVKEAVMKATGKAYRDGRRNKDWFPDTYYALYEARIRELNPTPQASTEAVKR